MKGSTCSKAMSAFFGILVGARRSFTTVVGRNLHRFDLKFIHRKLLEQGRRPDLLMNGAKITVPMGRFTVCGSLSFIMVPLSKFPKMFGVRFDQGETL